MLIGWPCSWHRAVERSFLCLECVAITHCSILKNQRRERRNSSPEILFSSCSALIMSKIRAKNSSQREKINLLIGDHLTFGLVGSINTLEDVETFFKGSGEQLGFIYKPTMRHIPVQAMRRMVLQRILFNRTYTIQQQVTQRLSWRFSMRGGQLWFKIGIPSQYEPKTRIYSHLKDSRTTRASICIFKILLP